MRFKLQLDFPDDAPPDWMKQMPLEIQIAIKMFKLDSCSTFANMTNPLIEIGETLLIGRDITGFKMDPAKKASTLAWLQDSPSSPDIPIKSEEIICVHRIILQYVSDEGVPSIEDTAFVSARSLLNKATTLSSKLNNLKQSLQKVSKVLKGFNILLDETMKRLDNLKETFDTAIKAENIKVNAEVKPENIKVEPDIYLNSHS